MQKSTIQHALMLTRFEFRHSWLSYSLLAAILFLLIIFSSATLPTEKSEIGMGMDYHFLFVLLVLPALLKMQPFRSKSVGNFTYLAPIYVLAKQLPINRSAYIMYVLFSRFLLSFVVTNIYLIGLYPSWELSVPFSHYISFILLWTALTFILHSLDAYTHFGYNIIFWIGMLIIMTPILFILLLLIFHIHFYSYGFVHWTLEIATQYPVYVTIVSLLLIIVNISFWRRMFRYKMHKTDLYY